MQISINDLFNATGNVQDIWSLSVKGHRHILHPVPGVTLLEQSVCASKSVEIVEQAQPGLYLSFYSSASTKQKSSLKKHQRANHNNDCVQVTYLPKTASGTFPLEIDTSYNLTQIHLTPERCASLTGETEDKILSYFLEVGDKLGNKGNVITLSNTHQLKEAVRPLLVCAFGDSKSISLTGKIYNLFFEILEHLQITKHINACEDCQNKILSGQNLLEVAFSSTRSTKEIAQAVGLNQTAFELGFHHLTGQSTTHYQKHIRVKQAALKIKDSPEKKSEIVMGSGLSEEEFEETFLKQFGVLSHQYGQIH
ncbi:helix-turn-helix domain-containing protein [Marinomonas balearica]|uniref:HTH araC/xylS-type domain-containing protein n=1 Tax=Marinomonas balearica TaxID=491947 RepID=A0A4R6MFW3_9GAMM|nr:hypothetical protein [Marinomonas balearica]TDO99640.1 hypothetical protein DFP79_0627 [Marinomonas balearica]